MSEVLKKIREQYPQYADTGDEELALGVGSKFPVYLEQDPEFKQEFQEAAGNASLKAVQTGVGALAKVLENPAAGEAAQMGRDQGPAARLEAGEKVTQQILGALQDVLNNPAAGEAASQGRAIAQVGRQAMGMATGTAPSPEQWKTFPATMEALSEERGSTLKAYKPTFLEHLQGIMPSIFGPPGERMPDSVPRGAIPVLGQILYGRKTEPGERPEPGLMNFSTADLRPEAKTYLGEAGRQLESQVNLSNLLLIGGLGKLHKAGGPLANWAKSAIQAYFMGQGAKMAGQALGARTAGVQLSPQQKAQADVQTLMGGFMSLGVAAADTFGTHAKLRAVERDRARAQEELAAHARTLKRQGAPATGAALEDQLNQTKGTSDARTEIQEQTAGAISAGGDQSIVGASEEQTEAGTARETSEAKGLKVYGTGAEPTDPIAPVGAKASVAVPIIITREMEAGLKAKGYSQEQVDAMTPAVAHEVLTGQKPEPQGSGKAQTNDEVAAKELARANAQEETLQAAAKAAREKERARPEPMRIFPSEGGGFHIQRGDEIQSGFATMAQAQEALRQIDVRTRNFEPDNASATPAPAGLTSESGADELSQAEAAALEEAQNLGNQAQMTGGEGGSEDPFAGSRQFMWPSEQGININRAEFALWYGDLKGSPEAKRQAIAARIAEEDFHRRVIQYLGQGEKTWPDMLAKANEATARYWSLLSPYEQALYHRMYSGTYRPSTMLAVTGRTLSDAQLGHEVLRYRLQQLGGMLPSELAEKVGLERWNLRGIDLQLKMIRGVRELMRTQASLEQRAMLRNVETNLQLARAIALARPGGSSSGSEPGAMRPLENKENQEQEQYMANVRRALSDQEQWDKDYGMLSPEEQGKALLQQLQEAKQSQATLESMGQDKEPGISPETRQELRTYLQQRNVERTGSTPGAMRPVDGPQERRPRDLLYNGPGIVGNVYEDRVNAQAVDKVMTAHRQLGLEQGVDRWRYEPKSNIVTWLLRPSGQTMDMVEDWLGEQKIYPQRHEAFFRPGTEFRADGQDSVPGAMRKIPPAGDPLGDETQKQAWDKHFWWLAQHDERFNSAVSQFVLAIPQALHEEIAADGLNMDSVMVGTMLKAGVKDGWASVPEVLRAPLQGLYEAYRQATEEESFPGAMRALEPTDDEGRIDQRRYQELSEQFRQHVARGQAPPRELWQELEDLKNKYQGIPPGQSGPAAFRALHSQDLLEQKLTGKSASPEQILGVLRNNIHPDEYQALKDAGLESLLSPGAKYDPRKVAEWIAAKGPRVEVLRLPKEGDSPKTAPSLPRIGLMMRETLEKLSRDYPGFWERKPDGSLGSLDLGLSASAPPEVLDLINDYNKNKDYVGSYLNEPERRQLEIQHLLDGIDPGWRDIYGGDRTNLPRQERELLEELDGLEATFARQDVDSVRQDRGYTARGVATPKEVGAMTDPVDLLVRIPVRRQGDITANLKHSTYHYAKEGSNVIGWVRGYMEPKPEGGKIFHIIEVQSDWANELRTIGRGEANLSDPLLNHYERLALKAAIDHARANGATAIAISDGPTAMMSEGHDRLRPIWTWGGEGERRGARPGDWGVKLHPLDNQGTAFPTEAAARVFARENMRPAQAVRQLTREHFRPRQEAGMRLHYDQILPKIARELTGEAGRTVDFGSHVRALNREHAYFKEPNGQPKTSITARLYDISRAHQDFSLFGRDIVRGTEDPQAPGAMRPIDPRREDETDEQYRARLEAINQSRRRRPRSKGGSQDQPEMLSQVYAKGPSAADLAARQSAEGSGALPYLNAQQIQSALDQYLAGEINPRAMTQAQLSDLRDRYRNLTPEQAAEQRQLRVRYDRPRWNEFVGWATRNLGPGVREEQLRGLWEDSLWDHMYGNKARNIPPASPERLDKWATALKLEGVLGLEREAGAPGDARMAGRRIIPEAGAQTAALEAKAQSLEKASKQIDLLNRKADEQQRIVASAEASRRDARIKFERDLARAATEADRARIDEQARAVDFDWEARILSGTGNAKRFREQASDLARLFRRASAQEASTPAVTPLPPPALPGMAELVRSTASDKPVKLTEGQKLSEARERYRGKVIAAIASRLLSESVPSDHILARLDVMAQDLDWTNPKHSAWRDVSGYESANPGKLWDLFKEGARSSGDPYSVTKRLAVLLDKASGQVYMVAAYPEGHSKQIMAVDPRGTIVRGRPHVPLASLTGSAGPYRVLFSGLLKEPVKGFLKEYADLETFNRALGAEAQANASVEPYREWLGDAEQHEALEQALSAYGVERDIAEGKQNAGLEWPDEEDIPSPGTEREAPPEGMAQEELEEEYASLSRELGRELSEEEKADIAARVESEDPRGSQVTRGEGGGAVGEEADLYRASQGFGRRQYAPLTGTEVRALRDFALDHVDQTLEPEERMADLLDNLWLTIAQSKIKPLKGGKPNPLTGRSWLAIAALEKGFRSNYHAAMEGILSAFPNYPFSAENRLAIASEAMQRTLTDYHDYIFQGFSPEETIQAALGRYGQSSTEPGGTAGSKPGQSAPAIPRTKPEATGPVFIEPAGLARGPDIGPPSPESKGPVVTGTEVALSAARGDVPRGTSADLTMRKRVAPTIVRPEHVPPGYTFPPREPAPEPSQGYPGAVLPQERLLEAARQAIIARAAGSAPYEPTQFRQSPALRRRGIAIGPGALVSPEAEQIGRSEPPLTKEQRSGLENPPEAPAAFNRLRGDIDKAKEKALDVLAQVRENMANWSAIGKSNWLRRDVMADLFRMRDGADRSAEQYATMAANSVRLTSFPGKALTNPSRLKKFTQAIVDAGFLVDPLYDKDALAVRKLVIPIMAAHTMAKTMEWDRVKAAWADIAKDRAEAARRHKKYEGPAPDELPKFVPPESIHELHFEPLKALARKGMEDAQRLLSSNLAVDKYVGRAWLKAATQLHDLAEEAQGRFREERVAATVNRFIAENKEDLDWRNANGANVVEHEDYVPGRYDPEIFQFKGVSATDRVLSFGDMRVMGKDFRKPKTFNNYYEAIGSGAPYVPITLDSADLLQHSIVAGRREVNKRLWLEGLKNFKDPASGLPMAVPPGIFSRPTDKLIEITQTDPDTKEPVIVQVPDRKLEYTAPKGHDLMYPGTDNMGNHVGQPIAVRSDYARAVGQAMERGGTWQILGGQFGLQVASMLKHGVVLILDTYHVGRLAEYGLALGGKNWVDPRIRVKGGWSALNLKPADLEQAVAKGVIPERAAVWAREPIPYKTMAGTRFQSVKQYPRAEIAQFLVKQGLNATQIVDALYRDAVSRVPIIGPWWHGKLAPVMRWTFDRIAPGIMMEAAVRNFERLSQENPKINSELLIKDIVRDTNMMFGNMSRQGVMKSPTFRNAMQVMLLAPMWQEGLLWKEFEFYKRNLALAERGLLKGLSATGLPRWKEPVLRRGLPAQGMLGRGITRGLAAYFVGTQIINLISRGHLTFQNPEPDHRWDAWVPNPIGKGGLWLSPMAVFGEVLHDIVRYSETKPRVMDALYQTGANKAGPVGRAIYVFMHGQTMQGEYIPSTVGVVGRSLAEIMPAPAGALSTISAGKPIREVLSHTPGLRDLVSPNRPGEMFQRTLGMAGIKTQLPTSNEAQMHAIARKWLSTHSKVDTIMAYRPTTESSYSRLRRAIFYDDQVSAKALYKDLLASRGFRKLNQDMRDWARQTPVPKNVMGRFLMDITPQEQAIVHRGQLEKAQLYQKVNEWMMRQPDQP